MSLFHLELLLSLRCYNCDLWNKFTLDEMIKNGQIIITEAEQQMLGDNFNDLQFNQCLH